MIFWKQNQVLLRKQHFAGDKLVFKFYRFLLHLALVINRKLLFYSYSGVKVDPRDYTDTKPSGDLFHAPGLGLPFNSSSWSSM